MLFFSGRAYMGPAGAPALAYVREGGELYVNPAQDRTSQEGN